MLPRDFFLKLHYYNEMKAQEYRANAELIRLQTVTLLNVQLLPKDRIRDPKKLWTFGWEETEEKRETEANVITENIFKASKLL